jgi:7-cyano-7-deazaguanine synthase
MENKKGLPAGRRAVVLLSGGLDSATALYLARAKGFRCFCLIFDYGQRHFREVESAKHIAKSAKCKYQLIKISLPWKGSALLNKNISLPRRNNETTKQRNNVIPLTYVPGRNIIFLSFAISFAEAINAQAIFIGAHCQDYSGYPDCRRPFFRAIAKAFDKGTKKGAQGERIKIAVPLINKTKAQIIRLAKRLDVPLELTYSCYAGGRFPCGKCDSCLFREKGFREAAMLDPLMEPHR